MSNPGRSIRLRSGARTDTGRVRGNNEDSIHLWSAGEPIVLAVVADGMGGAVAGEEASRIAVETIRSDFISPHLTDAMPDLDLLELVDRLKMCIRDANANIIEQSREHPELKGMGTTITLALVINQLAIIGHVGDSRAYHVSEHDEQIKQVSIDHTFVQALVNGGHLTPEEAEDHPMSNVLYRALGQAYDIDIDVYHEELEIGDRLVLCSDGLTLHVRPQEIAQAVLANNDPEKACQALINLANERGGRDNISAIVIQVDEDEVFDNEDSQKNPLGGNEDSGHPPIPRENTNMGASESPAMTVRETSTQEVTRVVPPTESPIGTPAPRRAEEFPPVERDGTGPGEGRDPLLPDQ